MNHLPRVWWFIFRFMLLIDSWCLSFIWWRGIVYWLFAFIHIFIHYTSFTIWHFSYQMILLWNSFAIVGYFQHLFNLCEVACQCFVCQTAIDSVHPKHAPHSFPGTSHYSVVIKGAMTFQTTVIPIVCSTVCSGADQSKHQSSASLAFVRGIHQWRVGSPHKGPVTRKAFSFDEVIMVMQMNPTKCQI